MRKSRFTEEMGVAERCAWANRVKVQMEERLPAAEMIIISAGKRSGSSG